MAEACPAAARMSLDERAACMAQPLHWVPGIGSGLWEAEATETVGRNSELRKRRPGLLPPDCPPSPSLALFAMQLQASWSGTKQRLARPRDQRGRHCAMAAAGAPAAAQSVLSLSYREKSLKRACDSIRGLFAEVRPRASRTRHRTCGHGTRGSPARGHVCPKRLIP
jgi:hypothetical protein